MNSADSYINYTIDLEATGKNIRTLMKMTGYTVRELERLIGCTQMTFFNWEEGKNLPGFDNLTEGDTSDDGKFYPDRGDIVQLSGKTILVLTKEKHNRATHSLTGVCLVDVQPDITSLSTITYVRNIPELVEKGSRELVDAVLKEVKGLFR